MSKRPLNGTGLDQLIDIDEETLRLARQCVENPAMSHPDIPKHLRRKPAKQPDLILQMLGIEESEPVVLVCPLCGGVQKRRSAIERGYRCNSCENKRKRARGKGDKNA